MSAFKSAISKVTSSFTNMFEINQATLSGSIDIIVVEQEDGSLMCTPFHVRFGKLKVLNTQEKEISIIVNDKKTPLKMKIGKDGEGYFEIQVDHDVEDISNKPIMDSPNKDRASTVVEMKRVDSKQNMQEKINPKDDPEEEEKGEKVKKNEGKENPDEEDDESEVIDADEKPGSAIEFSLCRKYIDDDGENLEDMFEKHKVPYSKYSRDPIAVLSNPDLMVKIDDQVFDWKVGLPQILSLIVYNRPLPERIMEGIYKKVTESIVSKSTEEHLEEINKQAEKISKERPDFEAIMAPNTNHKAGIMKTLRPTSDMLKELDLNNGVNTMKYVINTSFQGEQTVEGFIYFWDKHAKIIISDVDGTITRSDVLGNILPAMGRDWSHPGVASLYNSIQKNGYNILYLTSRAIGQSAITRNYLTSLQQEEILLPRGPIIMSPDRLMTSFKREIVLRQPEIFKIAALRDIRRLFPEDINPFVAGFGNRETDAIAYRSVSIAMSRIFIINPKGEIHQLNNSYTKTYSLLNAQCDEIFPKIEPNMDEETFKKYLEDEYIPNEKD